jgi:hypothetical protein
MDNASCHRNENVTDFIIKSKNDFVYIFTVPPLYESNRKIFQSIKVLYET